jgi:hypothetical protein
MGDNGDVSDFVPRGAAHTSSKYLGKKSAGPIGQHRWLII